jgi:cation transport regulator ChaC
MSASPFDDGWRGGERGGIWYFAYGSNMSEAIFCARRGMRPLATTGARLDGYQLHFNLPIGRGERGVANVEPAVGARTYGVAYLLTRADLDRLDHTEGVHFGAYRRIPVEVVTEDGTPVTAITYRSWRTDATRKPSARYRQLLLDGARAHGLPPEYVRDLERLELAWDERLSAPAERGSAA